MSDVKFNASRGKGTKKKTVSFKGILSHAKWAELTRTVKALADRTGLSISISKTKTKKRAKKK